MAKYEVQLTETTDYTVVVEGEFNDLRATNWKQHTQALTPGYTKIEDTDITKLDDNDARPAVNLAEITGAANPKPPTWQIQVHLSTTGVIRSAKIYHKGEGAGEHHYAGDRTTLEDVVTWANRHTRCDAGLHAGHVVLV